jgi:lipopolysaccharide transport system permease protein
MAKRDATRGAGRQAPLDVKPRRRRRGNRPRTPASTSAAPQDQPVPDAASRGDVAVRSELVTAPKPHLPSTASHGLRVVKPPDHSLGQYFANIWRLRPAYGYFVTRYLRKRYGRTFFGYLWFLLPYVIPLFLGTLVFGGILGVSVPGVPYFLYYAVTLGVWLLFSQTAYLSTRSLEINRSDIRRMYIPRFIPLMSAVTLPTTAFFFHTLMALGTVGFYVLTRGKFYLALGPATLLVIPALAMLLAFAWAVALWFSTLAPRARDVRRMAGYVLGFWYFLTPVMYPISQIPSGYRFLASLNPITTPIEMIKEGLLGIGHVTALGMAAYFGGLVVATVGGLLIFVTRERRDVAFY